MTVRVVAERFHIETCNSETEREFIEALHARSQLDGWYPDCWPRPNRFVLSVTISDPDEACVLRSLRVDFDGRTVYFGPDPTHQFETNFDSQTGGVDTAEGRPIPELANIAADWLKKEMERPIARHEWDKPDARGCKPKRWVLRDIGEPIGQRGMITPEFGPPDRVVTIQD